MNDPKTIESANRIAQSRSGPRPHAAAEGIHEWFAREEWLLTARDVELLLRLRGCLDAGYYTEWNRAGSDEPGGLDAVAFATLLHSEES